MRFRRRWVIGLLVAGAVLGGLGLALVLVAPHMAYWLDVGELPRQADYILVLAGQEDCRPLAGAVLYQAGLGARVLVTEEAADCNEGPGLPPPGHVISRRMLVRCGVRQRDILMIGSDCESTFDEAQALAELLDGQPQARVLVVTSDYHARRARWIIRRVLGERAQQVSFVSAPTDTIATDQWWQREEGFLIITGEYLKLAFYGLRYGHAGYWVAGVASMLLLVVVLWGLSRFSGNDAKRRPENGTVPLS